MAGLNFVPKTNKAYKLHRSRKKFSEGFGVEEAARRAQQRERERLRRAQEEVAGATFKPVLSAAMGPASRRYEHINRRVTHLQQYGLDRHTREQQRRELLQQLEDLENTFAPEINESSLKVRMAMQLQRWLWR